MTWPGIPMPATRSRARAARASFGSPAAARACGGYRVITFYSGADLPVFLLTVFAKGERSDLTKAERNALAQLTKALVDGYRRGAGRLG